MKLHVKRLVVILVVGTTTLVFNTIVSNITTLNLSKWNTNLHNIQSHPDETKIFYRQQTLKHTSETNLMWDQHQRLEEVKQLCGDQKRIYRVRRLVTYYNWVSDKYKATFCLIPKVACTNMKTMLAALNNSNVVQLQHRSKDIVHDNHFMEKYGYPVLSTYSLDEQFYRMDHYHRVIIVRHPLARVLSAYRSKFTENNKYYQKNVGTKIIKEFRKNATQQALENGDDVSFLEFVKYLLSRQDIYHIDPHWQPYHVVCDPCNMQYTYISKLETLDEDVRQLRQLIFNNNPSAHEPPPYDTTLALEQIHDYYATIPASMLEEMIKLYEIDFDMFGYSKDLTLTSK